MQRRLSILALLSVLIFSACDTSDPAVRVVSGIYVGNQGNFTENNGSVTIHDPDTGETTNNAIPNLGGLVQGILIDGDRAFVLLNFDDSFSTGRGRIDIVDLNTNQRTAQIDINTPRSAVIDGNTMWVTNLYANTVTPVDLTTNTPGTPITVGTNPEGLVISGNTLFVANNAFGFSTTVTQIDTDTRAVERTIDVGCDGPKTLTRDNEGQIWVFCVGKTVYDPVTFEVLERTNGAVVVLDGTTGNEMARMDLEDQLGSFGILGQEAFFSTEQDESWAIVGTRIARFNTATNALVQMIDPEIPTDHAIGGVAYDEVNDWLLLGTVPPDFVSAGTVVIADRQGTEVSSFSAGITPASIAIREGLE